VAVIELKSSYKEPFLNFARNYEYKSISFISRMNNKGQLHIPSSKIAKVFCEVSDTGLNQILNAIMITSGGIVMPLFSDNLPSHEVIREMIKKIIDYKSKIFCILGITKDTEYIKNKLNYSSYSTTNYSLLKENTNTRFSISHTSLKVRKAKKKDTLILFSLEKAYLLEEVLQGNTQINHKAVLLNLKNTCADQSVYYGLFGKKIIAKVNTNGKGFGYNQIGGVYTIPEYRSQGISTCLMKTLLNDIHISGKKAVLYVKKENKPALALYKKIGFDIVDDYSAHYIIS